MKSPCQSKETIVPALLTVTETATLLRIQRAKVYDLIESGSLRGAKVGHTWRIRTQSVEEMIGPLAELYEYELCRANKR